MSGKPSIEQKKNFLYLVLSGIFLTNAVLAEIVGAKLFSLEGSLGISEAAIYLFGEGPFSFTLTAGVILWPVVFITTDVINEYFGRKGVRRITFLTVSFIIYVFIILWFVTRLAPSPFWLNNYPDLKIDQAFNAIFLQGMGIIIGSLTAFLIGQLVDVATFHSIRKFTGSKHIWLRATGSTLVSQLIDSFVVLLIAFYVFNDYPLSLVLAIGCVNYIYKFGVAVILTPLLYLAHYIIDGYLGKEAAHRVTEEASENSYF